MVQQSSDVCFQVCYYSQESYVRVVDGSDCTCLHIETCSFTKSSKNLATQHQNAAKSVLNNISNPKAIRDSIFIIKIRNA